MSNQRIPTNANSIEIATSLNNTIKEIELNGETPKLKEVLLFKYARLKFSECEFEEAHSILGQCNSVTIDFGLPENYEIYFWTAQIMEAQGNIEKAKSTYEIALKRFKNNPDLISKDEIIEAIERINKKTGANKRS
jgi:tetratricopeptide (TPR) repeat protein